LELPLSGPSYAPGPEEWQWLKGRRTAREWALAGQTGEAECVDDER